MTINEGYYSFPSYLQKQYGKKIYKLPVGLPLTCPNRDGTCGTGGCSFCGEIGATYEGGDAQKSVLQQLQEGKARLGSKHKAAGFIAYFQSFTNTYLPLAEFKQHLQEAASLEGLVAIYIATRPDCVSNEYLAVMSEISLLHKIDICVELGLQSVNYHTLDSINRGHGLAAFIDAVQRIKAHQLLCCAHLILNLPGDTDRDAIEAAQILSALQLDQVKLHALFIPKNTIMGKAYAEGKIQLIGRDEYQKRVILFLRHLSPQIVVQRLVGRASDPDKLLFVNWGMSWQDIHAGILRRLKSWQVQQGDMAIFQ